MCYHDGLGNNIRMTGVQRAEGGSSRENDQEMEEGFGVLRLNELNDDLCSGGIRTLHELQ